MQEQPVDMQMLSKIKRFFKCHRWFRRRSVVNDRTEILDQVNSLKGRATMTENREMLKNRDYTLIIDKSGSMAITDDDDEEKVKNEREIKTRWELMEESTIALASKCEKLDPDGITVYVFSDRFTPYTNVTARKVAQIFEDEDPFGQTNLVEVLQAALSDYFQRKAGGQTKLNGETILIVTDGKPDDQVAVARVIVEATQKIDKKEDLTISFIQIGKDKEATKYLKILDTQLEEKGAKYDIVNTITIDEIVRQGLTLTQVLLNAIQ